MQVNPTDAVVPTSVPAGAVVSARVLAGNLTAIPLGALLQATVTQVAPRETTLTVNGQSLTIHSLAGLEAGAVLFVRVPKSANGTLEVAQPARVPKAVPQITTATEPVQVEVVEVAAALPDGRVRVRINGHEQLATPSEPLAPGGRFVLEVTRTPGGVTLRPPLESAALPTDVATAILRAAPAPDIATTLKPLQSELAALVEAQPAKGEPPVPPAVRDAATTVRATLQTLVPSEPRALDAPELQRLVENGGIHFEAKLARLAVEPASAGSVRTPAAPTPTGGPTPAVRLTVARLPNLEVPIPPTDAQVPEKGARASSTDERTPDLTRTQTDRTASTTRTVASEPKDAPKNSVEPSAPDASQRPVATALRGDLKGDLLRLLQTAQELGVAAQVPAARAALDGIESQQATQTLAQATATPYLLQFPFPDGSEWRTLHLSVEREVPPNQVDPDRAGRFRMLMHVPLSELGDTWIDAGLSGGSFRAAIYLDRADVRERVVAALPELHAELRADGFDEVLLDVRPTTALPANAKRQSAAMAAGRPASASLLDVRV